MNKMYVITIQDCSSSMCISGFIFIAIVPIRPKAEKIAREIEVWLKSFQEIIRTAEENLNSNSYLDITATLKNNPPPEIGVKWNYGDLMNFVCKGCEVCCDEVQAL